MVSDKQLWWALVAACVGGVYVAARLWIRTKFTMDRGEHCAGDYMCDFDGVEHWRRK